MLVCLRLSRSADANAKTAGLGLDRCISSSPERCRRHTPGLRTRHGALSPSRKTVCASGFSLGSLRRERRLPLRHKGSSLLGSVTDLRSDYAPLGNSALRFDREAACGSDDRTIRLDEGGFTEVMFEVADNAQNRYSKSDARVPPRPLTSSITEIKRHPLLRLRGHPSSQPFPLLALAFTVSSPAWRSAGTYCTGHQWTQPIPEAVCLH
jgi:hypothetical protein